MPWVFRVEEWVMASFLRIVLGVIELAGLNNLGTIHVRDARWVDGEPKSSTYVLLSVVEKSDFTLFRKNLDLLPGELPSGGDS